MLYNICMGKSTIIRFVEFFVVGLVFGLSEDLLAISLSTDATITGKTVLIVFLVALPFAVFSELIVDHPDFWRKLLKRKDK